MELQVVQCHIVEIELDVMSYNGVIDASARKGEISTCGNSERASHWLSTALSANLEVSPASCGAVIDACVQASDLSEAELWLKRFISSGIPLLKGDSSVKRLIAALVQQGKANNAATVQDLSSRALWIGNQAASSVSSRAHARCRV